MAVYQSVQTTTPAAGTSVVITKPTSLAVGDIMVAHIAHSGTNSTINTPTGWTDIADTSFSANFRAKVLFKVVDAGDVAASNFTFTGNGTGGPYIGGAILRINGSGLSLVNDGVGSSAWSGTSANLAIGITATRASDLYLILVTCSTGFATLNNISAYAIATSNPSWTEAYEVNTGARSFSGAYATRAQITATGNVSFNSGRDASAGTAVIVAIASPISVTTDADSVNLDIVPVSPAVSFGANFAISAPVNLALGLPIVTSGILLWTNIKKSVTSWVNQTKN